jgi:hypothetical protein
MSTELQRLKEEANIEDVCNYMGVKIYPKNIYKFISCPLPEHNDKHPSNCYFKKGDNFLYCTVCCKKINAIDLIMNVSHCDFKSAMQTLYEIEGCPDWFHLKGGKSCIAKKPLIKASEAALIGLDMTNWDKYLYERELKSIITLKCINMLKKIQLIELNLNSPDLFKEETEKIKTLKRRIENGQ